MTPPRPAIRFGLSGLAGLAVLWRDRRGSMLPLAAVMTALALGGAAMSVDLGTLFVAKRRVQGAADLAPLAAAQDPADANRLARLSLADQGVAGAVTVETGRYVPDAASRPDARFVSAATPANAVRVTLAVPTPIHFAGILQSGGTRTVAARATAAKADYASFAVGSRLLGVEAGLLNRVLGALLGVQIGLTAMDYEALASTRLTMLGYAGALATTLNLPSAPYGDVLKGRATLPQSIGSAVAAASRSGAGYAALSALRALASALSASTVSVPQARLFDPGDLGSGSVTETGSAVAIDVALLDFVANVGLAVNVGNRVEADLGLALPGIAGVRLAIAIGERPQGGSWTSIGAAGTTARTAQTRLLLEATVTLPLGLASLRLPIYAEAASAEATLASLACPWSDPSQLSSRLSVRPSPFELAIADVTAADVSPAGPRPDLSRPAPLITGPVRVTGGSRLSLASPTSQTVSFSQTEIERRRAKIVSSGGFVGATVLSLVGGLSLDVTAFGLPLGLTVTGMRSTVAETLAAAAPPLDAVLDGALRILGVGIGQADAWMNGVSCGRAVLVH